VQGFGNVGGVAAEALHARGVRVLGVSDHSAAYFDPRGLDVPALLDHARRTGALAGFSNELAADPDELLFHKCDILIPAAMEQVITGENAGRLRCRILAEGANGPTTPEADRLLAERRDDVFIIPDILCNSGGVIVSYFEWVQDLQQFFWGRDEVIDRLYGHLDRVFDQVADHAARNRVSNRVAAMAMGVAKVRDAKRTRGLFP
jgi:glutamate dehydrogenase (NAD(P)+)